MGEHRDVVKVARRAGRVAPIINNWLKSPGWPATACTDKRDSPALRAADLALGSCETLSPVMNDGLRPGSSTETVPADVLPGGDISPRSTTPTTIQHNLMVPMRDGTLLAMDLIRPAESGSYPVVLVRTPYDKSRSRKPFHIELAERGYIVAIQDTRGRFNSDGVFFPYRDDRPDGFDTVEWVAVQDWCSGSVGMLGRSYVGQTQWFAAADDPRT